MRAPRSPRRRLPLAAGLMAEACTGAAAPSPGSASSGKSRSTGPAGSASRSSAARRTRCCRPGSSARPSAWPNGKGTKSARGGFTFSVCSRTMLIDVVAMPSVSSARASTPPVCVQKGQVGVMSAACTPASRRRRPDLGPGLRLDPREIALGAHERVVVGRDTTQLAARDQLAQPVDGERDVDVAHDRRAVESEARVALDDLDRGRSPGMTR